MYRADLTAPYLAERFPIIPSSNREALRNVGLWSDCTIADQYQRAPGSKFLAILFTQNWHRTVLVEHSCGPNLKVYTLTIPGCGHDTCSSGSARETASGYVSWTATTVDSWGKA